MPKVLLLAWEKFFEIQHAFREKQHQPEDIQELLRKLLKDLQIISEELAEYISPSWNCPAFYDDDDEYTIQYKEYLENSSNAITPDLPTEEPDNSLKEVKDDILHEKLLNINLFIAKIESLNDNPIPDCVLKSPSPFPIPVEDSDSFFEKFDTSLSYSDNSLPEFETFSDHTEETSSGSNAIAFNEFYWKCGALTNKCGGFEELMQVHLMDFNSSIFGKICGAQCWLFNANDSLIPLDEHLATFRGNRYSLKDKKRSQNRQNQAREWKEREKSM
ncbi:hypothetical protein Tco_0780080 [Tanacetum coccineum]